MMLLQALLTVLLQSSFSTVISSPISPRGQCITAYVASSSRAGLDLSYLQELSKSFLEKEQSNSLPTRSKVVLDVGLASMSRSEVFEHMMQLNISGVDHSERLSLNCRSNELSISPRDLFSLPQSEFIYVQGSRIQAYFPALNWVSLLQLYPESKVLMNDMTDEEYLSNQFKDSCTGKSSKPLYCYVPLVPLKGRKSLSPDDKFLLSKFSPAKLSQILHAYREVIKCLVPEGQLFRFNLRHISSADYWTGLTHLLGLNYSTTANAGSGSSSRTVFYLDHLIAGGLKAEIKPRQVCVPSAIGKDTVCTGKKDILEVSPSVCEDTLLPAATAKRLTQCATRYAETMDSILSGGGRYRTLLLDQMLYSSPNTLRRAPLDSSRLIMNVAPGTTGTTSLFLTMSMLNITGRHFAQYRVKCTSTTLRGGLIDWDMKILSLPQYGASSISGDSVSGADGVNDNRGSVFWADTPVSERWWQVFRMYPHSKIMMTDVRDDAVWIRKRRKEHCGSINTRAGCTMPIPIDFHRIYNTSETANAFYNAVHVSRVKSDQGVRMFAAFRSLIRCAVPPEQQMWIYFSEQNDSAVFWNSLISFTNVSIKHSTRQVLINAGIPKSSQHTSCSVGNEPCEFVARGNDSAIIPSVCAPSKKYAN